MKTNKIMDEIRSTISPEMKMQMELTVAIANRFTTFSKQRECRKKNLLA